MNRKILLLTFALSLLVLSACTAFTNLYNDHTEDFQDLMALATFIEIENDDGTINQKRVHDLFVAATEANEKISMLEVITSDQIKDFLIDYVNRSDSPPSRKFAMQRLLVRAQRLIDAKAEEINEASGKIQDHTVIAKELVQVVLDTLEPYR